MKNILAKKSLGQNFLKSKVALAKMLEAGEVNEKDIILEVGTGQGVLTEKLLAVAKKVITVEKDDRLIPLLQEKFASEISAGKLEIIHGDILSFQSNSLQLTANSYKIIANIPYYITGQFLRKFLEQADHQPERIVVMVQKEIAHRIIASDGKESLLSISVKAYGQPKIIMKVGKENFSPAPKVDSAILLISNISKKLFTDNQIREEDFFKVLRAGFAHKRKILNSNLKGFLPPDCLAKLPPGIRAENLKLENWFEIIKNY